MKIYGAEKPDTDMSLQKYFSNMEAMVVDMPLRMLGGSAFGAQQQNGILMAQSATK